MSDDIKKLVERLDEHWGRRRLGDMSSLFADAADALEALAEKLQRETKAAGYWMERFCAAENERDRLKAALETIAEGRDSGRHDGLPEEHPAHSAVLMHYIACEALEGREWERFGNEKVAVGAGSQIIGKGADQFIVDDPFGTPTDPASAVCEWTDSGGMLWATNCGQSYGAFVSRFGKDAYCPHCDKIIKFSWRPRNEPVAVY